MWLLRMRKVVNRVMARVDVDPTVKDPGTGRTDEQRWADEAADYLHNRLERVQTSGQNWLTALATLLGLAGTAVLFKGSSTLNDVTGSRAVSLALVAATTLVFVLAILAVGLAATATWGGLRLYAEPDVSTHVRGKLLSWLGQLSAWLGQSLAWVRPPPTATPSSGTEFETFIQTQADRRRAYLHASRWMGMLAAVLAGMLVLATVAIGTFNASSSGPNVAPSLIVVHNGMITCGQLGPPDDHGTVRISGQQLTGVTQILPTDHC
jgi:hypothetical protein